MKKVFYLLFIISILLNIWLLSGVLEIKPGQETTESRKTQYPHLANRILVENPNDLLVNFMPLRTRLRTLIQNDYNNNFSIYFEYLPTGTSIGVNEKVEFYTASLIKVPIAMAYYHHKEKNAVKQEPLLTLEEKHFGKAFGDLWKRGVGTKISAEEAVNLMLTESDNTAYNMILDYVDPEDINYIFEGLDVPAKDGEGSQIIMTVKAYSSILKALFFSAIISKDHSQHILELLTKTNFKNQLAAGVPLDIPVAHKIGTFEISGQEVISDCGIVYLPKRSYVLCMASRNNKAISEERMKTVSKIVYEFVSTSETSK